MDLSKDQRQATGPQTSKEALMDRLLGCRRWIISGFRRLQDFRLQGEEVEPSLITQTVYTSEGESPT